MPAARAQPANLRQGSERVACVLQDNGWNLDKKQQSGDHRRPQLCETTMIGVRQSATFTTPPNELSCHPPLQAIAGEFA
jgi:hypothetical protein